MDGTIFTAVDRSIYCIAIRHLAPKTNLRLSRRVKVAICFNIPRNVGLERTRVAGVDQIRYAHRLVSVVRRGTGSTIGALGNHTFVSELKIGFLRYFCYTGRRYAREFVRN